MIRKVDTLTIFFGILNLSAFNDQVSEKLLVAARAEPNAVKKLNLFKKATLQIQQQAHLTNVSYLQYALTYGKKVQGVGLLPLAAGGQRRLMTNFGIDWTGVWKSN